MEDKREYVLRRNDVVKITIKCVGSLGFRVEVLKNGSPLGFLETRELSEVKTFLHKVVDNFEWDDKDEL